VHHSAVDFAKKIGVLLFFKKESFKISYKQKKKSAASLYSQITRACQICVNELEVEGGAGAFSSLQQSVEVSKYGAHVLLFSLKSPAREIEP
jgi:hypothetical protein